MKVQGSWRKFDDGLLIVAAVALALTPLLVAYSLHEPPPPLRIFLRAMFFPAAAVVAVFLSLRLFGVPSRVAGVAVGVSTALIAVFPIIRGLLWRGATPDVSRLLSLGYCCVCLVAAWAVIRRRPKLDGLVKLAAMVVVLSFISQSTARVRAGAPFEAPAGVTLPAAAGASPRPDIYHIILDGLGRPDILKSRYGVDVSDLTSALRAHGFDVDDRTGAANYVQTALSLASMLNGVYVEPRDARGATSRQPLFEMIQRSSVIRALKDRGYAFDFIGSIYLLTSEHPLADACYCGYPLFGEFESTVAKATPFSAIGFGGLDYRAHRRKIAEAFGRLEALPARSGPRYALAHIMSPHPPFVWDSQSREVHPAGAFSLNDGTAFRGSSADYLQGYAGQVRYVVERLKAVVERLESESRRTGRAAVIIIHGDHGPRQRWDVVDATKTDASESLPVFLAIRWAGAGNGAAAPRSLVNVYRALFNRYFDQTIPLLPDRGFVSSFSKPYDFIEVDPAFVWSR